MPFEWIPKILAFVDFVPNCCFANVVTPGYDIVLFTFGMIFPDVANSSLGI